MKDKHIRSLLEVISVMKELQVDLPLNQLEAFLVVTREEGLAVRDYHARTGQPFSSMSRNIRVLTDNATPTRSGYGLVEIREALHDRRSRAPFLLDKGKELGLKIDEILDKHYGV